MIRARSASGGSAVHVVLDWNAELRALEPRDAAR
jgi:hypothetical protein